MQVRLFDWRDIPTLHRYRHQCVYLDSALILTRGPTLFPGVLFSNLAPATGVFTCVQNEIDASARTVIGQFTHPSGLQFAHLTFLTPDTVLEQQNISALLEYIVSISGERGAMHLLADVEDRTGVYEALRGDGFAIYARQRAWRVNAPNTERTDNASWRQATSQDALAIGILHNNLVPGMVQQIEPLETQHTKGLVYYKSGELVAFVEIKSGRRGIWVQPFVHPDLEEVTDLFAELLRSISNRSSQPLYICVRTYQSWLEGAIEDLGAEPGPQNAVMVRHLAVQKKAERPFALPALDGGQPEISAPIVRIGNGTTENNR